MADAPVVHIGENSPEQVALKLLEVIAKVERKRLYPINHDSDVEPGETAADRKWILDTYGECLATVHGKRSEASKGVAAFSAMVRGQPEPD